MKPNLKSIVVCFIAAPIAAIGLFAGAESTGLNPDAPDESQSGFHDRGSQGMGQGQGRPERGHPLMALADIDRDGLLLAVEIQALPQQLLAFDGNGDGALDEQELREAIPPPPHEGRQGPMGPPRGDRSDGGPGGFPYRGE